jgi:hypothetical protein
MGFMGESMGASFRILRTLPIRQEKKQIDIRSQFVDRSLYR